MRMYKALAISENNAATERKGHEKKQIKNRRRAIE